MRFSYLMTIMLTFGCGEDPILAKVNSDQSQNPASKPSEQTVAKEQQQSIDQTMPTIAPPKDAMKSPIGQLPKVAPPSVEPPKEQPKEAVPPPPPNPKIGIINGKPNFPLLLLLV